METDNDGYLELNDGYLELGDVDQEHADFSQRIQSEVENETADSTTYMYNQEQEHENWHPFSSKAECLLYILMNSSTHHVSDEVVKFIIFMMAELGISSLPTLQQLKSKKIGKFNWEDIVTKGFNEEKIPIWILKPSQILKLGLAHPNTAKKLKRSPEPSVEVTHPANGKKWTEEIPFAQQKEDGTPVVTMPLNLFLDDTSTHKSKRWLPLHCVQMQLTGLPIEMRQKQNYIQFVGATEKGDIMDVVKMIGEDIKDINENGIDGYDAHKQEKCSISTAVSAVVSDTAMTSYCCNHLGATATKYCPRCEADAGHFMTLAQRRTPAKTQQHLTRLNMRSSENDKKELRRKKGVKEHSNELWDLLDPHRDMPVGLLHLIPLGLAQHLIKFIFSMLPEEVIDKLMLHLLYMVPGCQFIAFNKHLGSRQGKDFKQYLQMAPINMAYAGVARKYIKLVVSLAKIQKMLNETLYGEEDLEEMREAIREYHQLIILHAPKLTNKVKTHLLLHVIEDIERHGPPSAYVEDGFERNHGNIRDCIFNQNQKARSRDTSVQFAKQLLCSHVVTGGYYETDDTWIQAANSVLKLSSKVVVKKYLGIEDLLETSNKPVGAISFLKRGSGLRPVIENPDEDVFIQAMLKVNYGLDSYSLTRGSAVRAASGEIVHSGQWVKFLNEDEDECFAQFKEGFIVRDNNSIPKNIALLDVLNFLDDKEAGCPKLKLTGNMLMIPTEAVVKRARMYHDCRGGACRTVQRLQTERIEQEHVVKEKLYIKHNSQYKVYILNIYAL
ncbi:uncharacterized protein LOC127712964 [Mytilus californianus]|uniref:uncharacterized protein LOC127712964 n=1 Tax=Mytilus californianus TaxID=6549 RepID=UPI00224797F8|nr:uncharacterized protein LOC127712964 [Mytilus californianus]